MSQIFESGRWPIDRTGMKKPPWLVKRLPNGNSFDRLRDTISRNGLHTVCQAAHCPNIWECFSKKTATFLILGHRCTRDCRFCAISSDTPFFPDPGEPSRVAVAAKEMGLSHVVVTSVTRDDLQDGGAAQFIETIRQLRNAIHGVRVEVLIPDFNGNEESLKNILDAGPHVLNHNLETACHLYPTVRPRASYRRSLSILERAASRRQDIVVKSGLMLGIGESDEDIKDTLKDLRSVNCTHLTLGQYLQPSEKHLPVHRFIPPESFDYWRREALEMGFCRVASGPFVRSSYNARDMLG